MTGTDIIDGGRASRRALLGLGAALVAGAVGGADLLDPGEAAIAAPAAVHHGRQYASASLAAKKAGAARSAQFKHDPRAHLLRRATFGARPSDVAALHRLGIDGWLDRQLHPSAIHDRQGDHAWKLFHLAGAAPETIIEKVKPYAWDAVFATAQATLARQIFSERQLFEIVVDIFANHLHVPLPGEQWQTAPSYITDVIRAHAFGHFDAMLHAAMKHPAMLNFLSNDQSQKADVNENLGRELLELHTVGLAAGYSEKDVRSSARILSGRTWNSVNGRYFFEPAYHATGHVKVLGFSHANATAAGGEALGDAYLHYLAHHPDTARNIARKIATRFVSDTPSASLVNRLAHVYLVNHTSIPAVVRAVFTSSDFWASVGTRMRRPLEDAVGTMRVLDVRATSKTAQPVSSLYWALNEAGQTPLGWQPPNGYPDFAAAWLGAGAMLQRWNSHRALVYGWGWTDKKGHALIDWTPSSKLTAWHEGMTAMQWAKAVAHRLLGVTPSKRHLTAALHGAQLHAGDPAPTEDWVCGKVAALLLDSPYFQLR